MADSILRVAQEEEAFLVAELRQVAAFRKLEAVRLLIATYQDISQVPAIVVAAQAYSVHRAFQREGSQSTAVGKVMSEHFRRTGRRAQAPDLMDAALAAGIEVKGDKPVNTLASILSASPLFNNVRGRGYGLVEWGQGDGLSASAAPSSTPEPKPFVEQYAPLRVDPQNGWGAARTDAHPNEANPDELPKGYSMGDDGRIKEEVA